MKTSVAAALLGSVGLIVFAAPAFAGPNYSYTNLVVSQQQAGATDGAILAIATTSLNDKGYVAFAAQYRCGTAICFGAYTAAPSGALTRIAEGGVLTSTGSYQNFYEPVINARGDVSFGVQAMSANVQVANWLNLWRDGSLTQITPAVAASTIVYANPRILSNANVLYGDSITKTLAQARRKKAPLPVAPGYCTQTNSTGSSLNGWVAFSGGLNGAACGFDGIVVAKVQNGPASLRIANDGTYGTLGPNTLNQTQTVAFIGRDLPGRATHVDGLFLQKPGQPVQTLAEIDNGVCTSVPPAAGSCLYRAYDPSLAINPKGVVAANVRITTWNTGAPAVNGAGVALNGDVQNGQLAFPGMVINGCTVQAAGIGPRAINKAGQIAILLRCLAPPGGLNYSAIVLATPPPKK